MSSVLCHRFIGEENSAWLAPKSAEFRRASQQFQQQVGRYSLHQIVLLKSPFFSQWAPDASEQLLHARKHFILILMLVHYKKDINHHNDEQSQAIVIAQLLSRQRGEAFPEHIATKINSAGILGRLLRLRCDGSSRWHCHRIWNSILKDDDGYFFDEGQAIF